MIVSQRLVHPEHCNLKFIDRKMSNIEKFVWNLIGLKRETFGPSATSSTLNVYTFQQTNIDNYRHNKNLSQ